MAKRHVGSSFDDFLSEEGLLASTQITAIKRVISYLLQEKINTHQITKTELAKKLKTSRSGLDRLLDPDNTSVTLGTLAKAADYTGKHFNISVSNQ